MVACSERGIRALINPKRSAQGLHVDPVELPPPNPQHWAKNLRTAWFSREMELFCDCLRIADLNVRESVLDDLSKYYHLSPEECRFRCLHWEELSVREWRQRDRSTREGVQAFYDSLESWSFDLSWYAYLQCSGYVPPTSVIAAQFAEHRCPGGAHLDFGSGIGVTAQLFSRLGFTSTLADISKPLLDFACWHLTRHGDRAHSLLLTSTSLPTGAYDIVTAIDSLFLAPDYVATANELHRVIRPGGWLITNFDERKKGADESAWHLHNNAVTLDYQLNRIGFVRRETLCWGLQCYQRVEPQGFVFRTHMLYQKGLLPIRHFTALCGRVRWPTPRRVARVIARAIKKRQTRREE